ncbi:MAG TPA: NAD(P)H-binding protein [bacterium]
MTAGPLHVVTGAFGYTGRFIARRLLQAGKRVRTLTGNPARPNPFGERLSVAAFDFDNPDALARSLEGAAVLYNTYWVRFPRGRVTFETAVANTRTLIRACERAGVPRIVHLSVTNASADSPLPYYRGKGILEQAITGSTLSYAVLRPALVFGPGDILVNNIAWFLRRSPLFPVMGTGAYRLQGVYIDDLAEIAVQAGERRENSIVDLVSPEIYTFDAFVRLIAAKIGSRAGVVHWPPAVVGGLLGAAGLVVGDVVLTRDEMAGLMAELLVSSGPPRGRTRFADWLDQSADALGRTYASELDRHFRSRPRTRPEGPRGAAPNPSE